MKKLSVIIVNYNVCYFLEQALKSVLNGVKHIDAEIFVVDNNSVDGSVEMVREKFPEVVLIDNQDNVGFSKANNQAIRQSTGEYVLLLNPDTVVEEETFSKCCQFMDDHPDAGGLGVKMVDGSGEFLPESKRALPTPEVAFYKIFGLSSLFSKSKRFGKYHLGYLDEDEVHEVEILAGAFMLMRRQALDEVGLLDEDYFMYGEDIDLSWRLIKGGYKNYYYPETRIIHYKGESTKRTSINYVFIFFGAMIIFANKHFSKGSANLFTFLIKSAIYLKASVQLVKNVWSKILQPIADFGVMYLIMYLAQDYWEISFKPSKYDFPSEYTEVVIPLYLLIYLVVNRLSGGDDHPYRISKILRGVLISVLIISAGSNFIEGVRYSKFLILFSGVVAGFGLIATRAISHFYHYKTWRFNEERVKNVALVGQPEECSRVETLLRELNISVDYKGFILPEVEHKASSKGVGDCLGSLKQLQEIIKIYKVDELIFCSKDVSAQLIIEYMINTPKVEFKTVPDESNYIIGSNSKNRPGDYYTVEVKFNLSEKSAERGKRLFDFTSSIVLLLFLPVVFLLVKNKKGFLRNLFLVLFGVKTWVGFSEVTNSTLPRIKNGVLKPYYLDGSSLETGTKKRLDILYAKNYTVLSDLEVMFSSFHLLGNS